MVLEEKQPAVYMLSNKPHGVIYTGVTSDLMQRVYEHKSKIKSKFASKYNCSNLVYYRIFGDMETAIAEEKRLKSGNRKQKVKLIESLNPEWSDLTETL